MPAYTDHHVHFLATVAARLSVDVTAAHSVLDMVGLIAARRPAGTGWVRAWGYDEAFWQPRCHPTRADLDDALPGRPLVLHHRSGHAAVLNSAALAEIGLAHHPDGVLFDRHDLLGRVPRLDPSSMSAAAARVSSDWSESGVVAFTDATHTNGIEDLELLASWVADGTIGQEVTAMIGPSATGSAPGFGGRVGGVRVGPVKLMAPDHATIAAAHAAGYPVAVHVVDIDALDVTVDAFSSSPAPPGTVDRIEHAALCLPEQVGRVADCGATVVVNPSFLVYRRAKYEAELSAVERPWLIRLASWRQAGVAVRAGSDSPVTPSRPAEMIEAAMAHPFSAAESLDHVEASALLAI